MARKSGPSRWDKLVVEQIGLILCKIRGERECVAWMARFLRAMTKWGVTKMGATMQKHYWTYIMASARNGTLYIGVTNDLSRRVWEHREGVAEGFTK